VDGTWTLDRAFGQNGNYKPKGVIYIVTGAGGAGLYVDKQEGKLQEFTDKYHAETHSFTLVDIQGKSMKVRQISAAGAELDSWQIAK
jgi:acid phosphatase type 7